MKPCPDPIPDGERAPTSPAGLQGAAAAAQAGVGSPSEPGARCILAQEAAGRLARPEHNCAPNEDARHVRPAAAASPARAEREREREPCTEPGSAPSPARAEAGAPPCPAEAGAAGEAARPTPSAPAASPAPAAGGHAPRPAAASALGEGARQAPPAAGPARAEARAAACLQAPPAGGRVVLEQGGPRLLPALYDSDCSDGDSDEGERSGAGHGEGCGGAPAARPVDGPAGGQHAGAAAGAERGALRAAGTGSGLPPARAGPACSDAAAAWLDAALPSAAGPQPGSAEQGSAQDDPCCPGSPAPVHAAGARGSPLAGLARARASAPPLSPAPPASPQRDACAGTNGVGPLRDLTLAAPGSPAALPEPWVPQPAWPPAAEAAAGFALDMAAWPACGSPPRDAWGLSSPGGSAGWDDWGPAAMPAPDSSPRAALVRASLLSMACLHALHGRHAGVGPPSP